MMDWARQACRDGHGVLFVPLEMSAQQMIERAISAEACVELNKLREPGCLDDDQWDRVSGAISEISQWPLYIDTRAGNVSEIRRTATAAKAALAETGRQLRLLVVDYLQLMKSESGGRGAITRAEEIGRFTRALKLLARELEVVVVIGSQFNRAAADPNKLPRLDELKESGSIEEDSDIVLALHRPHAIDGQIGMATADEITGLILKKQTRRRTGSVRTRLARPSCIHRRAHASRLSPCRFRISLAFSGPIYPVLVINPGCMSQWHWSGEGLDRWRRAGPPGSKYVASRSIRFTSADQNCQGEASADRRLTDPRHPSTPPPALGGLLHGNPVLPTTKPPADAVVQCVGDMRCLTPDCVGLGRRKSPLATCPATSSRSFHCQSPSLTTMSSP